MFEKETLAQLDSLRAIYQIKSGKKISKDEMIQSMLGVCERLEEGLDLTLEKDDYKFDVVGDFVNYLSDNGVLAKYGEKYKKISTLKLNEEF